MLIENFLFNKLTENNDTREGFTDNQPSFFKRLILFLLEILIMAVAGFLAWKCNSDQKTLGRIILTILAVIFSGFYILFYVIYHIIIRVDCPK